MKPSIEGRKKETDEMQTLSGSSPQIVLSQVEQTSNKFRLLRTSQVKSVSFRHRCDSGDASICNHPEKQGNPNSKPASAHPGKDKTGNYLKQIHIVHHSV